MEKFMEIIGMLPDAVDHIELILLGIIGIAMLIPGEQPEKFLKTVVDVIGKFSVKKK